MAANADRAPTPEHFPYTAYARRVSLLMAGGLSLMILLMPLVLVRGDQGIHHSALILLMWGIAAGFVHGVGFVPIARVWRWLFSPYLGWPLMLGGIAFMALG